MFKKYFLSFTVYTEMKNEIVEKLSVFLAELIGTGLLVFLGCMGCIAWPGNTHLQMTINFGLVVMMIIQVFGCVSGAHLNPAITAAAFVYKLLSVQMACLYFVGQLIGAFMGYGLLKVVVPSEAIRKENATDAEHGLCVTMYSNGVTALQAVVIEFVATMVLIWLFCSVVDPRNAKNTDTIPIKFGLTITSLACTIVSTYTTKRIHQHYREQNKKSLNIIIFWIYRDH